MAGDPTWFKPVCDDALKKVALWYARYNSGDVSATRKWMGLDGQVRDKVTKYAHKLRFTPQEIGHLVRLLDALTPTRDLVEDFRKVEKGIRRGRLVQGGAYEITLNFHPDDIKEVLQTLIRAKTGRLKTIDDFAKEQQSEGKDIFEL